jgi:hypothetical protein
MKRDGGGHGVVLKVLVDVGGGVEVVEVEVGETVV